MKTKAWVLNSINELDNALSEFLNKFSQPLEVISFSHTYQSNSMTGDRTVTGILIYKLL